MPKRTNEFQQVAFRIYEALAGTTAVVEESALLQEKNSDAKREVDILVTTTIAWHQIRVAIECRDHDRDQDTTWIDSLIGKYINLDVQRVVAVSHTDYSLTAVQKAAQHDIELLTLKDAQSTDWVAKLEPKSFQFFGFRNRPLVVGLYLNSVEQLKIEYSFEGEVRHVTASTRPIAEFFLEMWHARVAHVAGQKISEYVFSKWDRISVAPNAPRYCEIAETSGAPWTLRVSAEASITFDAIVWGVGTKYTTETSEPKEWAIGDKVALLVSAFGESKTPMHVTLVADKAGALLGAKVTHIET